MAIEGKGGVQQILFEIGEYQPQIPFEVTRLDIQMTQPEHAQPPLSGIMELITKGNN